MGQYPTGRLFEYDGQTINDLPGWPPKLDGVSNAAREAQTTVIYAGDVIVGVWPWGELWRYNPDSQEWVFMQRMFEHPHLSDEVIHPYDVENRGNPVGNLWGQRITSLVTNGPDLVVSTSAKAPCEWDATQFPFLAPEKWKSYGAVYRLSMSGHLGAPSRWTDGATMFEFTIHGANVTISQDGKQVAGATLTGRLADEVKAMSALKQVKWGAGIHGPFNGQAIEGSLPTQP